MSIAARVLTRPSRSARRKFWIFLLVSVASLVLIELTLRWAFGLGRPVLVRAHPTIEYLAQPNQELRRFGRRISYNAFGMRSPPLSRAKGSPREFRVLLLGDSVINGGSWIDQDALATTEIARELTRELARPVIVMNVSAGSWGPQNQLAYIEEYGLFECDAAAVLWSVHDLDDVPTFGPLSPKSHPTTNPRTALSEVLFRSVIPVFSPSPAPLAQNGDLVPFRAGSSMRALLLSLGRAGVPSLVLLHLARSELEQPPTTAISFLTELSSSTGASFQSLGSDFARSLAEGQAPYHKDDPLHTSHTGQHLIAVRILEWLRTEPRFLSSSDLSTEAGLFDK